MGVLVLFNICEGVKSPLSSFCCSARAKRRLDPMISDMIGDEANVIWSSVINPDMTDGFKATAIFTGFEYNFDQRIYSPNYLDGLFNKTASQVVSETKGSERLIVEPKSNKLRKLRVFIASPSDVTGERESLRALIANLNDTILSYLGLYMELVSWETHAVPDMGRPQSIINRIIDDIDIFIGILWSRIGTPTGTSLSGTLEEFEFAYKSWKQKGTPRIMFYFCDLPPMERGIEAAKQFLEVEKFKAAFPEKGLYWTYTTIESFSNVVRNHLTRIAHQIIA